MLLVYFTHFFTLPIMKCCVVLCSLLLVLLAVIFATVPLNLNNRMVLKYGLRGSVAIHTMVYGDVSTNISPSSLSSAHRLSGPH